MLHFADLQASKLSSITLKGAKSIQSSKLVFESSSDPTIHEYAQICIAIDQLHGEYPWTGKKYHAECFKKFTKKVLLFDFNFCSISRYLTLASVVMLHRR